MAADWQPYQVIQTWFHDDIRDIWVSLRNIEVVQIRLSPFRIILAIFLGFAAILVLLLVLVEFWSLEKIVVFLFLSLYTWLASVCARDDRILLLRTNGGQKYRFVVHKRSAGELAQKVVDEISRIHS